MRLFAMAAAVASLVGASAAGQDAVEIKVVYPKAGERVKVTVEEKAVTKIVASAMGQEQTQNQVKTKSLVYTDEVIENPGDSKRPTKLKRSYEKAVVSADEKKKAAALPIEGKTVLIEKTGAKYGFSVDGKALEGESLALLDSEFNKPESGSRELMFPGKPVKPGETWKIDPDKLAKDLRDKDFDLDAAKMVATGKLVKAYQKDGRQYGVIELNVAAPITGMGAKSPLKLKAGKLEVAIGGDGVIDGTVSDGKTKIVMTLAVTATSDGADIKIEATVTENRTVAALPKK